MNRFKFICFLDEAFIRPEERMYFDKMNPGFFRNFSQGGLFEGFIWLNVTLCKVPFGKTNIS